MGERDSYTPSRDDLWRLPEVMQRTGLRRSTIYERMNEGMFPLPLQLGPRMVAWLAGEVLDWIAARPRRAYSGKPAAPRAP
jgi:prophage regulatory protein